MREAVKEKEQSKVLHIGGVTHRCKLVDYGSEEKRCLKCGYITFNDKTKTDQEIITQMINDGHPAPDCNDV